MIAGKGNIRQGNIRIRTLLKWGYSSPMYRTVFYVMPVFAGNGTGITPCTARLVKIESNLHVSSPA
ncbi:MAG: hypothetical protein KAS98_14375 [Deltaproteobacteria bacterium]|nr:hypothetical protein [Deltaproteobacteria bacterium]